MLNKNHLLTGLLLCSSPSLLAQAKIPASEKPHGRVNFPSNFQVEGGANLFIAGEYLYWLANEDGLYFAQSGAGNQTGLIPPDGSKNFDGKVHRIHPEWDNGLRLSAGINFPKAGYDTIATWTWLATEGHGSAHAGEHPLIPLWAEPSLTPFANATQAKGEWHLNLNVFDLEWGRSSWFGGHFSLRPFFGLRGLWLDQALKNHFTLATHPAVFESLRATSDFRSGGLRAGADTRFVFSHGFSLYGIASGSLLYGRCHSNLKVKENAFEIARTKDSSWRGNSSLQLGLGLGWDSHIAKDRLHIEFHAGWEQNIWFGVNQMNHFVNQLQQGRFFKENSNLSTQGLVVGGRFDF